MLIEVYEGVERIRWYYCFAYALPMIIVAFSWGFYPSEYGTDRYCWLKPQHAIYTFIIPVVLVIIVSRLSYSINMCDVYNTFEH